MTETLKKYIKTDDGIDLYYETYTVDNKQPTLFFLHGTGGDLDAWHFVRDELLASGFSSIAMDLRGHGYSTHPRSFEKNKMKYLVEDVKTILTAEKIEKIILIGHCYGAITATHFALTYPEMLNKLVIISPSYRPPAYLTPKLFKKIASGIINVLAFISLPPIHPGHSSYPEGKFHKDYELLGLVRTILRNSLANYLLASKEIVNLDLAPRLASIKTPTHIISGEHDSIFPTSYARTIHSLIPSSSFTSIPSGNHVIILNNIPEVLASLKSFL